MNLLSILLLALILLWILAAVIYLIRRRGTPCCGDSCDKHCSHCDHCK